MATTGPMTPPRKLWGAHPVAQLLYLHWAAEHIGRPGGDAPAQREARAVAFGLAALAFFTML